MPEKKQLKNLDIGFIIIIPLILAASMVIQYTASYGGLPEQPLYYLQRHGINILIGLGAFILMMLINYREFQRFYLVLSGIGLLILVLVLIPGIGTVINNARRWIFIGPVSVQPGEIAKLIYILVFAAYLNRRRDRLNRVWHFIPCFAIMLVPIILIARQPDLGTALVFVVITLFMMYAAGANPKILFGLVFGGAAVFLMVMFFHYRFGMPLPLEDYQLMRLTVFLDPYSDGRGGLGAGYNIIQSLIAVGSGGLWGQGFLQGAQTQAGFLPYHSTDFVFSVIAEEFGFVGSISLLAAFLFLLYRALSVARQANDFYGFITVCGVVGMFFFQVVENVGMTIGVMPITGIPLPLISYGGTSMWVSLAALGLVASVSIRKKDISF